MRPLLLAALLAGCGESAFVVVTVEDPDRVATRADRILVGTDLANAGEERLLEGNRFPITMALTGERLAASRFTVEARLGDAVLARGHGEVFFEEGSAPLTVTLGRACDEATPCERTVYCSGIPECVEGICRSGLPPCPNLETSCFSIRCDEALRGCVLTTTEQPGC